MSNILSNTKIFFGTIASVVFSAFIWDKLNLPYDHSNTVIGIYSELQSSQHNNLIRFLFFILFPFSTFFILFIHYYKIKTTQIISIFSKDFHIIKKNNLLTFFLIIFFIISLIIFLIEDFPLHKIDHFHEGLALSSAYTSGITNNYWHSSYIQNSLFSDFLNAKIAWSIAGDYSVGALRVNYLFLRLVNEILIIYFIYLLSKSLNFKIKFEIFAFVFLCSISLYLNRQIEEDFYPNRFREIPIFLILISSLKLITSNKNNYVLAFSTGLLSVFSSAWSLDKGIYINAILISLIFIFYILKDYKKNYFILVGIVAGWTMFYLIIGNNDFESFVYNSVNIIKDQDLFNGLIYPTPFNFEFNEHAGRGTKNLIIIILNAILITTILLNKKKQIPHSTGLFLVLFFLIGFINYKTGISRADGYHMKQSIFYQLIFLASLMIINLNLLKILNTKKNIYSILTLGLFLTWTINFYEISFGDFNKATNYKKRYIDYVALNDKVFTKPEYHKLINELKIKLKDESCFQVFSYDSSVSYLIRKKPCTRYNFIYAVGSKQVQNNFINELKLSQPKYILIKGPLNDFVRFSPSRRFDMIDSFIIKNYKLEKNIESWQLLKKHN